MRCLVKQGAWRDVELTVADSGKVMRSRAGKSGTEGGPRSPGKSGEAAYGVEYGQSEVHKHRSGCALINRTPHDGSPKLAPPSNWRHAPEKCKNPARGGLWPCKDQRDAVS